MEAQLSPGRDWWWTGAEWVPAAGNPEAQAALAAAAVPLQSATVPAQVVVTVEAPAAVPVAEAVSLEGWHAAALPVVEDERPRLGVFHIPVLLVIAAGLLVGGISLHHDPAPTSVKVRPTPAVCATGQHCAKR